VSRSLIVGVTKHKPPQKPTMGMHDQTLNTPLSAPCLVLK
jgi:hypothetical protein